MNYARFFAAVGLLAALAACSGNLGGGQSTLPGAPPGGTNVQQLPLAAPTSTPSTASNVATVGDNVAPQALPMVMGWSGSIAFPHPSSSPAGSPKPKTTASPVDTVADAISIGITAGVVEPPDAPHLGSASTKRHAKRDSSAPTALFYISLLATADVTLAEYPKIALEIPRDIAAKHRDDTYALALYDPERKEKAYRLAVAERDLSSPLPGSQPTPLATAFPTPSPTPTSFGMPNGGMSLTPPPIGSSIGGGSLPPEHVGFKATVAPLIFKANRPVVFALYALPPQPSPTPSPSASATASGSTAAPASATPKPAASTGSPLPLPTSSRSAGV